VNLQKGLLHQIVHSIRIGAVATQKSSERRREKGVQLVERCQVA
jgi:hypothetical protein